VLLRDDGMSYGEIARVLFLSDEGVRQQIEDYLRQNGKLQPENGGSEARLTDEQAKKLEVHLDETIYTRTRDIVEYVKETFGVAYSVRGLTKWQKQQASHITNQSAFPPRPTARRKKRGSCGTRSSRNPCRTMRKSSAWTACIRRMPFALPDQRQPEAFEHSRRSGSGRHGDPHAGV
jgi:hypothetical protein